MCGIAGIHGQHPDRGALVRAMTGAIRHRGPDAEGFYEDEAVALGHRRLSIIDLSPEAAQPMANEDGTVLVAYNGEIYNFQSLRGPLEAQGHVFRSRSDTEVIVHLYEELGDACIEHLDGMFALAIWDAKRRRLLLARDRWGQKPLFYAIVGEQLLFASEIKALLQHPDLSRRPSPAAIDSFLTTHFVPAPGSFYEDIRRLPAASILTREGATEPSIRRFWDGAPAGQRRPIRFEEAAEEVDRLFTDAVRRQLVADVPVGVFASGGIDSTLVLAKVRQLGVARIDAFSVGFREEAYSELEHARTAAERLGVALHPIVIEADRFADPTALIEMFDEPFADVAAIPTAALATAARKHITVALTGDGGDEVFGGYEHHVVTYWLDRLGPLAPWQRGAAALAASALRHQVAFRSRMRTARRGLEMLAAGDWRRATVDLRSNLSAAERTRLLTPGLLGAVGERDPWQALLPRRADSVESAFDVGQEQVLSDLLLHKSDIACMSASLEARSPFLDVPLVDFVGRLPLDVFVSGIRGKRIPRHLVGTQVDAGLARRRKTGFSPPVGEWLRGKLAPLVSDVLLGSGAETSTFVQRAELERMFREHRARRADHRRVLWAALLLELWLRRERAASARDLQPAVFRSASHEP